jgi:hypothetical protein
LLAICFAPSLADSFIFLTLTRLVVVFIFVNFSFALFTPPLGDYQDVREVHGVGVQEPGVRVCRVAGMALGIAPGATRTRHVQRCPVDGVLLNELMGLELSEIMNCIF